MELLLFLSALLSAFTGALTGTRPAEARLHHAAAPAAVAVAAPRAVSPAPKALVRTVARVMARTVERPEGLAFALKRPAPLATVRLLE